MKNKIKLGFIGTGDMAVTHTRDLMQFAEDCEIAGIADISNERMDSYNRQFRLSAQKHTDYNELLSNKDIDAVFLYFRIRAKR